MIKAKMRTTVFFLFIVCIGQLFAQNIPDNTLLRIPVWYVLEEDPELQTKTESDYFGIATKGIRELSPFWVEALVYGWEFSYTPSDKTRNVQEYFEITPIIHIEKNDPHFTYTDLRYKDNYSIVEAWVEYTLSERMVYERQRWYTDTLPSIGGKGEASLFTGIDSVKEASKLAAKDAIREYARTIIKNKPKEIRGKILLTDNPRYYINAGKFIADLDFFLKVSKIVEYEIF